MRQSRTKPFVTRDTLSKPLQFDNATEALWLETMGEKRGGYGVEGWGCLLEVCDRFFYGVCVEFDFYFLIGVVIVR